MPLATYAEYATLKAAARFKLPFVRNSTSLAAGQFESSWLQGPTAGAAPSTAAACDRDTVGALFLQQKTPTRTNPLYLAEAELWSDRTLVICSILLMDRLSHQGGLSGTVTTAQTTNLPTAALTRYTTGAGVVAGLQWYASTGATIVFADVIYTNEAGTGSRAAKSVRIPASTPTDTVLFIPLADGDRGVRSVESVDLDASTGTAGNFGVTLWKPLAVLPVLRGAGVERQAYRDFMSALEEVADDACLELIFMVQANPTGELGGTLNFIEVPA